MIERGKMRRAMAILALMEVYDHSEDGLIVEAWSNCREQGFMVRNRLKSAVFAEQRNSDDTVVIVGPMAAFDVSTNMPNEDLWNNSEHHKNFSYGQESEAAKFILDYLMEK